MAKSILTDSLAESFGNYMYKPNERYSDLDIEGIPVLFGVDGSIVCIPRREETFSASCVGRKGSGKSLCVQRLVDEIFWNIGDNVAIVNDSLEETYDWNKAQDNLIWKEQLKQIDEAPTPLPIVYLFPNTNSLHLEAKEIINDISYAKISLPFSELVNNSEAFMNLGKSAVYLRNIRDELADCEDKEEVYEIINERITGKFAGSIRNKIINAFDNIFNEGILKISNKEVPSYLAVNNFVGNPFSAVMKMGCIPSFVTSDLYTKRYRNNVFAYHINSLFNQQFTNEFKNEKVYLAFDELTKVCSTEDKNISEDALNQISARGRMARMGLIYATQNYEKIPHIIRANTEYCFAFRHSNSREVNAISNDFDISKLETKEILNLEKFECIAITSEKFLLYYPDGSIVEETRPIKGRLIPPMSRHRRPSDREREEKLGGNL